MARARSLLAQMLAVRPVVLDGGLSNQLADQGCDLSGGLWSARVLMEHPEQIEAAHRAYVQAGAEVLITASYQATHQEFTRLGLSTAEASSLLATSVERAAAAAATAGDREVWVAASIGPYGAMLADGSEYRGRYGLSSRQLLAFHRPRMEALLQAGPDVLALETVPDVDEAEALLTLVAEYGVPAWLSYTVHGRRTRAGQPLDAAFEVAAGADTVIAVGVNCCDPKDVGPAVEIARASTGKPVVAYPNDGSVWDGAANLWRRPPVPATWAVESWLQAGARLVGGCCRVGPDRIAALSARWGPPH
ncbi:homocysteine S-methyltransferase [Streptomyces sp. NPDC006879]|uniref:homocysteine S-methyltransferase n=1 Tax=Streptomyces sp. NPDC006879 TaxID=3364767 RepID=UPI0036A8A0D8